MSIMLEEKPKTKTVPVAPPPSHGLNGKGKPLFDYRYGWHLGMIAWLLHRLSGLALIFYLCLHIMVLRNLAYGEAQFDQVMKTLGSPVFKVLEIGLLGVVLFHAFNGIRIVIIDFWGGARIHKKLFWWMMGIATALFIAGAIPMAEHMIKKLGR